MASEKEFVKRDLGIAKEQEDVPGKESASSGLGNVSHDQGDSKQAIEFEHRLSLFAAIILGDRDEESKAYENLGNHFLHVSDFMQAIEFLAQHLVIAKELGDKAGELRAYGRLGINFTCLGDLRQAMACLNESLRIAKELKDRKGEGNAYANIGIVYLHLGDFKQAIEYGTQHLSIAKEIGDRNGEGSAYGNLGTAYNGLSDFKKAIEYHKKDLSIAKELGNKAGEGGAYGNLGIAYLSMGDFKQAIDYHTKHQHIARELGDKYGEAKAYSNLGNALFCLGHYKKAIEYYTQRLRIAIELGDKIGEGLAYGNLGNAFYRLGDFKQAIEYHTKDLNFAKELQVSAGEARAYCNLGNDYQSLGIFKLAIQYHTLCLGIAKDMGDRAKEATCYNNLGVAFLSLGDPEHGIKYQMQQLSLAKELGDRAEEGRAYINLGNAYQMLGDPEQSIKYQMQHLNIANELGDKAAEGKAYVNLGNANQSLGNYKQAIKNHTAGLNIAKELGDMLQEGIACFSLGCDCELLGALHDALDYFKGSVKVLNGMRALLQSEDVLKIIFRDTYQHAYKALWRTLVRLEKADEALLVAEQGRAQGLLDLIKLKYDSQLPASWPLEPCATIPGILSTASTQTVFVALESNKVNFWVLHEGESVQFRQNEVTAKDVITFLKRLRSDVFKENQIAAQVKCENRSLDELRKKAPPSSEFEQETVNTPLHETSSLRQFFDCIIGPIADLLHGDELVIVPDGPLCLAPYAAFLDPKSRYLSESVKIRICPSLTSLKMIADAPEDYHRTSGALIVGDPCVEEVTNELGKPILSPLPYARREVKMIGDILDISPLIGKEATKDEVLRRVGSVALVHIAAHGDMKFGEIALAPNPVRTSKIPAEKDFMLKMSDLQDVQLRARLVVLSCCHSAQGSVTPEGVVGIARAFLGAGARSVLVSLWAIDDEATMEFMKHFYRHVSHGHKASAALNWAMKCLRESERFAAVKYWAPFVLIGDDVMIKFEENHGDCE